LNLLDRYPECGKGTGYDTVSVRRPSRPQSPHNVGLYNYLGFRLSAPPYGLGPAAIGGVIAIALHLRRLAEN